MMHDSIQFHVQYWLYNDAKFCVFKIRKKKSTEVYYSKKNNNLYLKKLMKFYQ